MSTNKNKNDQQQAAAGAAHINPFYIDPGELEQEWQGDYEWEDEYEAEGLLLNNDNNEHHQHHPSQSRSSSPRQSSSVNSKKKDSRANNRQQHHVKGVRLSRGQKRWICIVGFFALLIFFILSSTDKSSNNKTNNDTSSSNDVDNINHNNNDNGVETTAKPNGQTDSLSKDGESHDNNSPATNDDDAVVHEPEGGEGNNNNDDYGNEPASSSYVHRVVLLGERQTGVDAFRKLWADCFPTRNFTTTLTRKTYWSQDLTQPPPDIINNKDKERILFVLLVRNPYTWVEAMRTHPLYMSAHVNQTTHRALSWQDFVTRPWIPLTTTETDATVESTTTKCQLDFAPNQVMPCHLPDTSTADDAHPADVYELKPAIGGSVVDSGGGSSDTDNMNDLAFANILALRAAKLQHFISNLPQAYQHFGLMATLPLKSSTMPLKTPTTTSLIDNNVLIIHYEDDLVLSMQKLEQVTGWQPVETCHQAKRFPPSITLENLDPEYIRYLSQDSDTGLYWELEALIGYQKATASL
jgi:hypothetical protein